MALIACSECGQEVSSKATKCPSCGARLRRPRRGPIGQLFKWAFIAFNAFMAWWLITGLMNAAGSPTPTSDVLSPEAAAGAAAVGTGIGAMLIVLIWVMGDVILGLFALLTRARD